MSSRVRYTTISPAVTSGIDIWSPEFSRFQDKIRILEEDLDGERELRARIDRERNDLAIQLLSMNERLDDADCLTAQQIDINRKRETEMQTLRNKLEALRIEQDDYSASLRSKHQSQIAEMNEIIEQLQKAKNRMDKERQKLQIEITEISSQLDMAEKDRLAAEKTNEKLQRSLADAEVKLNEHVRLLNEANSIKAKLVKENNDLLQEVRDANAAKEQILAMKADLQRAYDEIRRSLDEEQRLRENIQNSLSMLEQDYDSLKSQLEEETEAKLELERQLVKANNEALSWKSKYDQEVAVHAEEVEEARRKLAQKTAEFEEQLSTLNSRCSNLEKAKNRLQMELDGTLIDLDKANQTIVMLEGKISQLERAIHDLKSKNEALLMELDESNKNLRISQAELAKARSENEKLCERNNALLRENKKLTDDMNELKCQLSDAKRAIADLEVELKRMEDERNEYAAMFKDAENARRAEEARANKAIADLNAAKSEFEKRLAEKDEEIERIKRTLQAEIDTLVSRLADTEAKMRAEISRIRKKLQAEISELEMSLDHANKTNIENMKTIKKLNITILDLKSNLDDVQRQLVATQDALVISQRKVHLLSTELEEAKSNLDNAMRAKKQAEMEAEEAVSRANELASINANLNNIKSKLEADVQHLQSEFDSAQNELRITTEKANAALSHCNKLEEDLKMEQDNCARLDTLKRNAESQVKELQIRIQEVEANALVTAKRMVSKLEARVREVEAALDAEKKNHAETHKILRKKDRRVKELTVAFDEETQKLNAQIDTINMLNDRMRKYKDQVGEIESIAVQHVAKSRRFQKELEDQEARAEMAESNLVRLRTRHRGNVVAPIPREAIEPIMIPKMRRGSIIDAGVPFMDYGQRGYGAPPMPSHRPRRFSVISF